MKKALFLLLFSSAFLFSPFLIQKLGYQCLLTKLAIHFPHNPSWEVTDSQTKNLFASKILNQKFFYLAQGYQSVVFQAEDGKHVLKVFFKGESLHPLRHFIRIHLLGLREKIYGIDRISQALYAAAIATTLASEVTGILFAHLNQTHALFTWAECFDSLGRRLLLNLNDCRFVIQLKGVSFENAFELAIINNDPKKFKQLTLSFITTLKERISKGIQNTDVAVEKNFGFVENKCIEWDFGQYEQSLTPWTLETKNSQLEHFLAKGTRFFQNNYPEWVSFYTAIIHQSSIYEWESDNL